MNWAKRLEEEKAKSQKSLQDFKPLSLQAPKNFKQHKNTETASAIETQKQLETAKP